MSYGAKYGRDQDPSPIPDDKRPLLPQDQRRKSYWTRPRRVQVVPIAGAPSPQIIPSPPQNVNPPVKLKIRELGRDERMAVVRKVMLIETLMLIATEAITFVAADHPVIKQTFKEHWWLLILLFGLLIVVFILYFFVHFEEMSTISQVVALIMTFAILTTGLSLLTLVLDTRAFWQSTFYATLIIISLMLFALLPCFDFSLTAAIIYIVLLGIVGFFVLIFIPDRSYFEGLNETTWISPPQSVLTRLFMLFLTEVWSIYFVWDVNRLFGICTEDQSIYIVFRTYVDSIWVLFFSIKTAVKGNVVEGPDMKQVISEFS
jgi:FtsH-binding integral membrane protein